MQVDLHEAQQTVFDDPSRFKVVVAGRRCGKTYLAAITLFVEAARNEKTRRDGVLVDLALEEVYYIAPTFEQGKKIIWPLLLKLGEDLIANKHENIGTLTLINGRRISVKGSDRPDSMRGVGLSYAVLDEYAFMKEEVWEMIVLPALARSEGGALFIGTPDGKNHFYDLYLQGQDDAFPDWKSWHFVSTANPFLPKQEIEDARGRMSLDRFKQEFEASFEASANAVLSPAMFSLVEQEPWPGDYYIACDLAGFESAEQGRKMLRTDDHAIAVVKSWQGGWCIVDVIFGKWDVRETALRIVKAWRDYRPVSLGIEKGMARNAVLPYLEDEMNRLGIYFTPLELTHGNQKKTDRIAWALQGRAEKGRIQMMRGGWNKTFLQQAADFPNPRVHDDLLDAVAYIDQLAIPFQDGPDCVDEWTPLDLTAGY